MKIILIVIGVAFVAASLVAALSAIILSGRISREEEAFMARNFNEK